MSGSRVIEVPGVGPVLFERSRRARRISVSVSHTAGVRVAVPYRASFTQAEEFVHTKTAWLQKQLEKLKQRAKESRIIPGDSLKIDRAEAGRKLTARLEYLARKHGFTYNRVFIRNQKTRWGSCSFHNNISLNMKLANLPEELTDYVILHELTHTRVKNHGKEFWVELGKTVPDARAAASRLKEYGPGIF
jgi:predicted metal-dependent hydrolase